MTIAPAFADTKNYIFQAQLADEADHYEMSDQYLQQAAGFIRLSSSKRFITSQQDPYIFSQQAQQEKVVAATSAWIEYIGSLMSRLLTNNGPDAKAVAAYAIDIRRKIDDLGRMALEEAREGQKMLDERDLLRRGTGLNIPGGAASLGWGTASGVKGGLSGALQNIKNIPSATGAWLRNLGKGTSEAVQETTQGAGTVLKGGPYPTPNRKDIPTGPNWQNPALEGKEPLFSRGYAQGTPYGITWEQASGIGRGEWAQYRPSEIYKDHPAMRDPSENSAGFKAMEEVWKVYVDQYLPKYGIIIGAKKGKKITTEFDQSKFPQVFEKASAVATPPSPNSQISPPPDLNIKPKLVDTDETAKINHEKEFFLKIFQQVEVNLRGEGGSTGATLKGVVKDGAFAVMAGNLIDMMNTVPLAGQAAGAAAGAATGFVSTRPGVMNQPVLGPATRGLRPRI